MAKAKKGTEFVCRVCGTTLVVTEEGLGIMEDIVCCETPMECRVTKPKKKKAKSKAKPKKKR